MRMPGSASEKAIGRVVEVEPIKRVVLVKTVKTAPE